MNSQTFEWTELDQRASDTAKLLAADAVQKVGNGHPGTPVSLAPAAHLLFNKVMDFDPNDDRWLGRDKFVLSAGHASLLQYCQLYLTGQGLELDDIKSLRTRYSKTPGHPEYTHTKAIEVTTGPLGSGLATAVGMAFAARKERGLFDPDAAPGTSPFDHFIYVVAGDGCLQEGVTSEASSLAGTQELGNLIVIWDDNRITIEDDTNIAFTEDVLARYEAYGWHTQHVDWLGDGEYKEDPEALYNAIKAAQEVTDKPSIIRLSTVIAWPAPTKQGSGAAHGAAFGDDEVAQMKEILGFDQNETFQVEDEVLNYTRSTAEQRGRAAREAWETKMEQWRSSHAEEAELFDRLVAGEFPENFDEAFPVFEAGASLATRAASGKVLAALAPVLPELFGGSADLAGSNNTTMEGEPSFLPSDRQSKMFTGNPYGRTLHFGVREFAMGTIVNGIALSDLVRGYGGTFLVFSDYMRASARLAAIMGIPSIFVWTHDSVGVGEDGPTHQPIEHLWSLRAIPHLDIVRPADANETSEAWKSILKRKDRPAGIILTRQGVPTIDRDEYAAASGLDRGAYVLADSPTGKVDVLLLATGSEVQLALGAREVLAKDGIGARVVSMPSLEWFAEQDEEYRESVLPSDVKARVSIEAGSTLGWRNYVGDAGEMIGVDHFGESANGAELLEAYGFTVDNVVAKARQSLEKVK